MPTILGVNFGGDFFGRRGGGVKPWKNKAENLAGNSWWKDPLKQFRAVFLKLRQTQIKSSTQI